ncbi:equatorin [Notamacropus eugenii]|uniref:equatorin n=1 Tax=Notamacropus eugenii TaxID=9315 RepID=UPI003B67A208
MNFFLIIFLFGLPPPGISKKFGSVIGLPETVISPSYNEDSNTSTEVTTEKKKNFSAESYQVLRDSMKRLRSYLEKLSHETPEEEIEHPEIQTYNDLGPNESPVLTHPDKLNEEERNHDLEKSQSRNQLNKESMDLNKKPKNKETEKDEKAFNDKNELPAPISDIPNETVTQPLHREDIKIKLMLGISLLTLVFFLLFMCISCFTYSQVQKKSPKKYRFKKNFSTKPELAVMSYFQPAEGVSETSFSKSAPSSTLWGPQSLDFKSGTSRAMNAPATVPFLHEIDAQCTELDFSNESPSGELELSSVEPHSMEISSDERHSKELPSGELPSTEAEDSGK